MKAEKAKAAAQAEAAAKKSAERQRKHEVTLPPTRVMGPIPSCANKQRLLKPLPHSLLRSSMISAQQGIVQDDTLRVPLQSAIAAATAAAAGRRQEQGRHMASTSGAMLPPAPRPRQSNGSLGNGSIGSAPAPMARRTESQMTRIGRDASVAPEPAGQSNASSGEVMTGQKLRLTWPSNLGRSVACGEVALVDQDACEMQFMERNDKSSFLAPITCHHLSQRPT